MASQNEVEKTVEDIIKLVTKVDGWLEESKRQIRSGKTNYIELKITFKVTN